MRTIRLLFLACLTVAIPFAAQEQPIRIRVGTLLDGKGGVLTPKQIQLVEIAGTAGEKLLRLITDYLDFAKIDAGYLRLDREHTELAEVVRRAIAWATVLATHARRIP